MDIASIGIDLGKNTFNLVALDKHSKVVIRKKFSRKQLLAYTANLQHSLIAHKIGLRTHNPRIGIVSDMPIY
ncbi:MAG TPA: hypothetical protein VD837_01570 [Terriglobales bacterium]|nr:hypothetical protein [Terriglobales bacterium]